MDLLRQPWEVLVPLTQTPWHWSKQVTFRPSWLTLPHSLSFSAQPSNCNVATRWSIELSILSLLHLSFNIHLSNRFNCSIKFFDLKMALGLALLETWLLLAQPRKNTDVCKGLFQRKTFLGKPAKITFVENKDVNVDSWIFCANPGRCLCDGHKRHGIDPNKIHSDRHDWLFHTACLSLHSRQTAMLPHVGPLNSAYSAFSISHSTFIFENGPWAGLGRNLAVACASSVYLFLFPWANLQKSPSSKPRMLSGKGVVFLGTADNSRCLNMLKQVSGVENLVWFCSSHMVFRQNLSPLFREHIFFLGWILQKPLSRAFAADLAIWWRNRNLSLKAQH